MCGALNKGAVVCENVDVFNEVNVCLGSLLQDCLEKFSKKLSIILSAHEVSPDNTR